MNRRVRLRIERNDPTLTELWICRSVPDDFGSSRHVGVCVCVDNADFVWPGDSIGKNTSLKSVELRGYHDLGNASRTFFDGFKRNESIGELRLKDCNLSEGAGHGILDAFGQNDNILKEMSLLRCAIGNAGISGLTATLAKSTSLRQITLIMCNIDDGILEKVIAAVKEQHQLKLLDLSSNSVGIDGCKSLATLLQNPNSALGTLALDRNSIGNDGAIVLANALRNNEKLEELHLDRNHGITTAGWDAFSRALCNTASINGTYYSNHTLQRLEEFDSGTVPSELSYALELNRRSDKREVAIKKILRCHRHFDMNPFFEWDLKVLPFVIDWFDRARAYAGKSATIDATMLSAMFHFIRAMPMQFVCCPRGILQEKGQGRY
ncbi:hypothetical protein ACHAXR_013103 [Thalassiosira sp. AJA248-18]